MASYLRYIRREAKAQASPPVNGYKAGSNSQQQFVTLVNSSWADYGIYGKRVALSPAGKKVGSQAIKQTSIHKFQSDPTLMNFI